MTYTVYYLANAATDKIVGGPFPTVDAAVNDKKRFIAPMASLLTVVKSTIEAVPV